jgi:Arc/MetJ family transcription regulator
MHKRTNIELDVDLLKKAMELTHLSTIKEVVNYSLREVIRINKRRELLKFKGKVDWEGNLDQMRTI